MQFTDLLRITVLLCGGGSTVLALVAVIGMGDADDPLMTGIVVGWWALASTAGLILGSPERSVEAVRPMLAAARTATQLPDSTAGRLAFGRLWPIGLFVVLAGIAGFFWPQVAGIGAGFLLAAALGWRYREAAVLSVEERDGVSFYVLPGSALEPVELMRTPGLSRDRDPGGAMPPPPAAP